MGPTISRLGLHPPVAPTTGAIIGSACPPMSRCSHSERQDEETSSKFVTVNKVHLQDRQFQR
ncbi:unnamed protein product [Leuciscus chuanchicus]